MKSYLFTFTFLLSLEALAGGIRGVVKTVKSAKKIIDKIKMGEIPPTISIKEMKSKFFISSFTLYPELRIIF